MLKLGSPRANFSDFLISNLAPKEFHAFDIFRMHKAQQIWGQDSAEFFNGLTQREFFENRFANAICDVVINEGLSAVTLKTYPDEFFDLIYVDGDHSYEGVKDDAALSLVKIKRGGTIVFNDYVLYDHTGDHYGVVPVVNELVVRNNLKVLGLSLQRHMYCDIAVRVG